MERFFRNVYLQGHTTNRYVRSLSIQAHSVYSKLLYVATVLIILLQECVVKVVTMYTNIVLFFYTKVDGLGGPTKWPHSQFQ
jgi:hypothetical protein